MVVSLPRLAVWAFWSHGVGRLLAKDTILREARNRLLTDVLHIRVVAGDRVDSPNPDLAAECRKGIHPIEVTADTTVSCASTFWHAKAAEGITCPSCVGWHALFWARLIVEPRRLFSRWGLIELFAAWAAGSAIGRTTG